MKRHLLIVMSQIALPALLLAAALAADAPAQQAQFDMSGELQASRILPSELVAGPNHLVQERVVNDGYLNIYMIDSSFGQVRAASTAQLRQYVHELNEVARMELLSNSDAFKSGLKGKVGDVVQGTKSLVTHPVDTVEGSVSGVFAVFGRVGEAVTSRSVSESEDSRLEGAIGFSKTKRDYAYEFKVDVYSRNQILQDHLDKLAWAQYGGSLTTAALLMAIPGGAGIAVSVSGATS